MGPGAKSISKKLLKPMLDHISYKDTLVRAAVMEGANKWVGAIGAENVLNFIFEILTADNPESRTECLKFIKENIESIPLCNT